MDKQQQLYRQICVEIGKEKLSDEEIYKITLFLQRNLGQPGDPVDLGLSQFVHVNPNSL